MSLGDVDKLRKYYPEMFVDKDIDQDMMDKSFVIYKSYPDTEKESIISVDGIEDNGLDKEIEKNGEYDYILKKTLLVGKSTHQKYYPAIYDTSTNQIMAFYLPFHQYQNKNYWGIYLVSYWVRDLGIKIYNSGNRKYPNSVSLSDGIKAAELFLYYILIFYHQIESFTTRLEISGDTTNLQFYNNIILPNYRNKKSNSQFCTEDVFSVSNALKKISRHKYFRQFMITNPMIAIDQALSQYKLVMEDSYNSANLSQHSSPAIQHQCMDDLHKLCYPNVKRPFEIWGIAGQHMIRGFENAKCKTKYLIPRGSSLSQLIPLRKNLILN